VTSAYSRDAWNKGGGNLCHAVPPPLLFNSFGAIAISMHYQPALRATIYPRRKRDLVSMATT